MEKLEVEKSLWRAMIAQAEETLPEECCGLAAGRDGVITEIIAVENALHSPIEFRMEPGAQIREMVRLEKQGLEVLAIYHSHPKGPEFPSATDVKKSMYPESYSIILSRKNQKWSGRGFRISGEEVEEIMIVVQE